MPATYEPIATTTLSSAAADITFSSIGSGYTDLRLVTTIIANTAAASARVHLNGDTGTNYSRTSLIGDGTSATSSRSTSTTSIALTTTSSQTSTTIPTLYIVDFFSYAGSMNKTVLSQGSSDQNGSGGVTRIVHLWRNTAAITSIALSLSGQNLATGTTATLYGILKA